MHEISESKGIYLYGNVALVRGECPKCGGMSILKNSVTLCCGVYLGGEAEETGRISEPVNRRSKPSPKEQKHILIQQGNKCFYCDSLFGSIKHRHDKEIYLTIHWDHRIPFVYAQDNRTQNFVASCNVCNLIKSSFIFDTQLEASDYIAERRKEKGYDF